MRQSGVFRSVAVVALVVVLAELYLQARNYAWLSDFFDDESGVLRSVTMPYDFATIRVVWIVAVPLLLVVLALDGGRRWLSASALIAFAASLWLTPSRMILPGEDPDAHVDLGHPDTAYQAALALIAFTAVALGALLLMPRKPA